MFIYLLCLILPASLGAMQPANQDHFGAPEGLWVSRVIDESASPQGSAIHRSSPEHMSMPSIRVTPPHSTHEGVCQGDIVITMPRSEPQLPEADIPTCCCGINPKVKVALIAAASAIISAGITAAIVIPVEVTKCKRD